MSRYPDGSGNSDDDFDYDGKSKWTGKTRLQREHRYLNADRSYAFTTQKGKSRNGEAPWRTITENHLPLSDRIEPEDRVPFWLGKRDSQPWVLYHLPELTEARKTPEALVVICEGEKDVETAEALGFTATCNPCGADKWLDEFSPHLAGCRVVIIPDNDPRGRRHADKVAKSVIGHAKSVAMIALPGLRETGDLSDWVDACKVKGQKRPDIIAALHKLIEEAPPWDGDAIDIKAPRGIGRRFLNDHFPEVDGVATLCHWRGEWHLWTGPCWSPIEADEVEAMVWHWLEQQRHWVSAGVKLPAVLAGVKPNRFLVGEVLAALRSLVKVPAETEAPTWLKPTPEDWAATEMVSVQNGLLHLATATLRPHSPRLFAVNSVQSHWNPEAWESDAVAEILDAFLRSIFTECQDDQMTLLQEMFGYFLTPDNRHQKAFMMTGPTRSGKGTIGRMLARMHAKDFASPNVNGLAGQFGKQQLIGKTVAVVADVRIGNKMDQGAFAETILSITGGDQQSVQRKGISDWVGFLPTRFLFISNELPRFQDSASVLALRFLYLKTDVSFYDREDHELDMKLAKEDDLILIWAVRGWQRLQANGRFTTNPVHRAMMLKAETRMKPIAAFVATCCDLGPEKHEGTQALYEAFCAFAEENDVGHHELNSFARLLMQQVPSIKAYRPKSGNGEGRTQAKAGIALKPDWRGEGRM